MSINKHCQLLGLTVPQSCPRAPCSACGAGYEERAAILEYGQGTGGSPEEATCANRAEAETLAKQQMRDTMTGQRDLSL